MTELDKLIRAKGGLFAPQMVLGELGKLLSYFHEYLHKSLELWQVSGPLDLSEAFRATEFSFLGKRDLHCFVFHNFIGMSIGYPIILANNFFALLAHPEFLPEVGNASSEYGWGSVSVLPETRSANQLELPPSDDLQGVGFFRLPRDPDRMRYATEMTLDALTFLLYHEIAHIFRGHLYVHKQATGFSFLDESESVLPKSAFGFDIPMEGGPIAAGELAQFFEIDADAVAADTLVYEKAPMDFPDSTGRMEEVVARLNRALVAISVLFLTAATPHSLKQYRNRSHPHPLTRHRLAFVFAASSVMRLLKLPDQDTSMSELRRLLAPAIGAIKNIHERLCWARSIAQEPEGAFATDFDDRYAFYNRIQDRLFVGKSTLAPLDR